MNKNFILATASLIGTIIGAGVFGIPYVMSRSGVLTSIFYFVVLGVVVLLLHLFLGEIVLRTKGKHHLTGYTEKYLGKRVKPFIAITTVIGTVGSLLAYVILAGKFLNIVFPVLTSPQWSMMAWALLSALVLFGIKSIAPVEVFMNVGLFLVIAVVFIASFSKIQASSFSLVIPDNIFLPFGVILFSLVGWNAVPEIARIIKKKKSLKVVIISTMLIVVCFYFLFGLVISGVTGPDTTQEAFQGLKSVLGSWVIILGGIFGVLAVSTSYLILGNYLKNTLILDYKFPKHSAFSIACFLPLILFLLGVQNFIWVIGIVGTFIGLVEGSFIVFIYRKAKKNGDQKPAYSLSVSGLSFYLIIAVLVLGALSQIIYG